MKILYINCGMGAAGDMLVGALAELLPDREEFVNEFNNLGIHGVRMELENGSTCGIKGTKIHIFVNGMEENSVEDKHGNESEPIHSHHHHGEHCHFNMHDVEKIINNLALTEKVKQNALAVYNSIAEAESKVHGVEITNIHFHELGTLDAIADVVSFCMLIGKLSPDKIVCSPIHVGSGYVHCAHGILPVPAPATAELLTGIPSYSGEIEGELCTPTGAALLRRFVDEFGNQPIMSINSIGYGLGSKNFPKANCVRVLLGEGEREENEVFELRCNLDDMTGESIGFAMEKLLREGALDVYTIAIGMKKSRPGVMLCCLCNLDDRDKMTDIMLKHTTSLGIRITKLSRFIADRQESSVNTPYGKVRIKTSKGEYKAEYEDISKIAIENNMSLSEVSKSIQSCMNRECGD